MFGPALARRPLPIRIGTVQTDGRTGNARLMPLPETPPEDSRDLIMKPGENEQLRVMARPAPSTADILAQLAASAPPPPPAALSLVSEISAVPAREPAAPKPSLDEVLREVLGDPEALYRNVAQVYQDFLVRCRQYGVNGRIIDLAAFRRKMATARAGVDAETADTPEWEKALALSTALVAPAVVNTLLQGDGEARSLARRFYRERVAQAHRQFALASQGFYGSEQGWASADFWRRRREIPVPQAAFSGQPRVEERPVLEGQRIVPRRVLLSADHPLGIWHVDGVEVAPLLARLEAGETPEAPPGLLRWLTRLSRQGMGHGGAGPAAGA